MYYFYILKSKKDKRLYLGWTGDLRKRIEKHNKGFVISTKYRRPLELVYYEAYKSRNDALRREKSLKLYAKAWGQLKRRIQESINK